MKFYKLLIVVTGLFLQLACGGSGSNNTPTVISQSCVGPYYYCPQGLQNNSPVGCQIEYCRTYPDNCQNAPNLYNQSYQQVSCL